MELTATEYEERIEFLEKLETLVKSEFEEVFRILKRGNESLSENTNGIFFNITGISKSTFDRLKAYMTFCMQTRNEQAERLKQMEALRSELEESS
jgi:hypothetical protein